MVGFCETSKRNVFIELDFEFLKAGGPRKASGGLQFATKIYQGYASVIIVSQARRDASNQQLLHHCYISALERFRALKSSKLPTWKAGAD